MVYSDIGLGQIEDEKDYNFKLKYDEEREIYNDDLHNCDYFEMPELKQKILKEKIHFHVILIIYEV